MQTDMLRPDREFLACLNRIGSGTVQNLCDELGVTATAVRQKLARVMSAEWVERQTVSAGRGRPYHVYHVTDKGRRQLGNDYGELARLMWRELRAIEDREVRTRLMTRLRDALVERYRPPQISGSLSDRFQHLQHALREQGFQVDVNQRESGAGLLPVLREHSCPYFDLAEEDSSICDLEQSVFGEVLGVPVTLTQCCRDGHSCCEFQVSSVSEQPQQQFENVG
ncbi:MAG: transcriptional regulator [Planctomycetaceae bacterium]|nr:transcriptional regulator [Planctomycetaceae bacterium]